LAEYKVELRPITSTAKTTPVIKASILKWIILLIPLAYVVLLMVIPMIELFKLSIIDKNGFTFKHFARIFTTPVYLNVFWITFRTSFLVTILTLIIAYPVAYLLVMLENKSVKKLIIAAVLIPFWISLLVRTYAWTIILQEQGVINQFLIKIGIIDHPIPLLYNTTGVVIGMTHVLLPYMVLSLYSVMLGIDQRLLQAAQGMGARPWKVFMQIFYPLSLPGVLSGCLMVFVLGIGFFITPALLGGASSIMVSMFIQDNVSVTLNWNLAAAMALILFVITLILLFLSFLLTRNNPLLKEDM
jgi:ABC-type spermidine/putrescine transport system permease subunit I